MTKTVSLEVPEEWIEDLKKLSVNGQYPIEQLILFAIHDWIINNDPDFED